MNNQYWEPANWSTGAVPQYGDDLYFSGSVSHADCYGLGGWAPSYAVQSIHLVDGYAGTVSLVQSVTIDTFEMTSGVLAQLLSGYGFPADLTVNSDFTWTGGVLNNTTTLAIVSFPAAATATISPPITGSLITGSTLSFEGDAATSTGSTGTITAGTISSTLAAATIIVSGPGTTLTATEVSFECAQPSPAPHVVEQGATYTAKGVDSKRGIFVAEGGTLEVVGQKTSKFAGSAHPTGASVHVEQGAIALVIENGSTLDSVGQGVNVVGGKLLTKAINTMGDQPPATIKGQLIVTGEVTDIKISDTALNPPGVTGHKFGQLKVEGDVIWGAGTYAPVVDGTVGSFKADLWTCTGTFSVDGKEDGESAKLAPTSINNPPGGIVGRSWVVMHSDVEITWVAGEEAPKPSPGWTLDNFNKGDKDLKVKYTG